MDFDEHRQGCPWWLIDNRKHKCLGKVHYNQHVHDPRYGDCEFHTCPIVYWIGIFAEEKK